MVRRTADLTGGFDLAVVGAGALGCALAWEAATRGVRVVLLEQDDFGSGASANSLKIVHGGLRYLQKLDLKRARASAAERSVFLRIAPHLVQPLPCILPTRSTLLRGRLAMAGGIAVNALVTADRNRGLRPDRRLPAGGLMSLTSLADAAPGLNLEGATAGARWFDAQMLDSERLPLAFALGAEAHGAVLLNHHRVTAFSADKGRIAGIVAENLLDGGSLEIPASAVADCRCAWAGADAAPPGSPAAPPFIKAVNVILPETGLQCALGFPMRDAQGRILPGRMLFATPWNGATIVGTWYSRDPRGPGAGVAVPELESILRSVNDSYGAWRFRAEDVRALHVGFLPALAASVTGDAEPVPMDKPLCEPARAFGGPAGLWHLQTEKWTTVRRLAEGFVDRLSAEGAVRAGPSRTTRLPLPGGAPAGLSAARAALRQAGLAPGAARRMEAAYGGGAADVLELARSLPGGTETVPGSGGVWAAELVHAVQTEHARTLGDVLRRTGIGSAGRPSRETLECAARSVAGLMGWGEEMQRRQVAEVLQWPQYRVDSE
ncbi:MAG: FAD-dependent oxidoreductase [Deferrisomatales bacterium]